MINTKYKVVSFRGNLDLERGLNEIVSSGYIPKWVFADNGKFTVVYGVISYNGEEDTVENIEEE